MLNRIPDRRGEERVIERRDGAPHVLRTGWRDECDVDHSLVVKFGLSYHRGNAAPYFTVTAEEIERKQGRKIGDSGGCLHEDIVREFPELADVIALHLADIDGAPMHAAANGWYQLAGACGGLGERYHAGNQETYGRPFDPLKNFAEHCRISLEEAAAIRDEITLLYDVKHRDLPAKERARATRDRWDAICEGFRPRWKAEANAAIEKYGLTVHGDPWPKK